MVYYGQCCRWDLQYMWVLSTFEKYNTNKGDIWSYELRNLLRQKENQTSSS
jgi:hypothetical protein